VVRCERATEGRSAKTGTGGRTSRRPARRTTTDAAVLAVAADTSRY